MKNHKDWSLTLVTDRKLIGSRNISEVVYEAVCGGVSVVQLREKLCSDEEFLEIALSLKKLLKPLQVPFIINDRIDLAIAVDADGVHIGQDDIPYWEARKLLGPRKIIGLSIENLEHAEIAQSYDVDYLGVSPIFTTSTKPDLHTEWGLENLKELRKRSKHILIGIGGICSENLGTIIRHGADGVAVVSEICASQDPRRTARKLREVYAQTIRTKTLPRVLTIACSDSGGGAGVEADLKTISALRCYGMSCFTALSAQNTVEVKAVHEVPSEFVRTQLEAVLNDMGTNVVKLGVVYNAKTIEVIAECLKQHSIKHVVADTVMVSKSGHQFISDDAIEAFKKHIFPIATVITPNLTEASRMLGKKVFSREDMYEAADCFVAMGLKAVLIKGGHGEEAFSTDLLFWKEGENLHKREYSARRFHTPNTHGTGCSLASAIACFLARGLGLADAVEEAKTYISKAIEAGQFYKIGSGHGPIHHFYERDEK